MGERVDADALAADFAGVLLHMCCRPSCEARGWRRCPRCGLKREPCRTTWITWRGKHFADAFDCLAAPVICPYILLRWQWSVPELRMHVNYMHACIAP